MKKHVYETQVTVSIWMDIKANSREEAERVVIEKTNLIDYGFSKKVTIHGVRQMPDDYRKEGHESER